MSEPSEEKIKKSVAARWVHPELFDEGFVGIPTRFLQLYPRLQPSLTSGEAIFVIQLMSFKWDEKDPFPSYKLLGERMGTSSKTAQRHATSLEAKRYLKRIQRIGDSNKFDLSGLFEALMIAKKKAPKRVKRGNKDE
ncbi:MAG: helix-turn-helix domain-containing protein [Pyrinomonadaceae bacterium]